MITVPGSAVLLLSVCLGELPMPLPEAGAGRLLIEALDGSRRELALESLDLAAPLPGPSLRVLGLSAPAPASGGERAEFLLQGGERLQGQLRSASAERFELELFQGVPCSLPLDPIARVLFPEHLPRDWAEPVIAPPEGDRLYLRVGSRLDRLDGTLLELDALGLSFESSLGGRHFAWKELAAVFLEPLKADSQVQPVGQALALDLFDGSRVRARLLGFDAQELVLDLGAGGGLRLPWNALNEALIEGSGWVFVSDLNPSKVEELSAFGDSFALAWPYQRDRAVGGSRLSVQRQGFARGLGVHAPSRLSYALGGRFHSLRGAVGVDDEVLALAARGSVDFRIFVDNELRWSSGIMRGGQAAKELPALQLAGAQELRLEVDCSEEGFVADRADWLRLVLTEAR